MVVTENNNVKENIFFRTYMIPKPDPMCDQYSRIFMVIILLLCSIVIGVNQYNYKVSCMVPSRIDASDDFIHTACWIKGMYVYKELRDEVDGVNYFGIPNDIEHDGYINGTNELCRMLSKFGHFQPLCIPFTKVYYRQYQWMALFVALLAILYILPYPMFCEVNDDLICLRENIKTGKMSTKQLLRRYFRHNGNAWIRVSLDMLVKALYVCASTISYRAVNRVLNGEFLHYGQAWTSWSKLDDTSMYDYMGKQNFTNPGNRLLPSFGLCEFDERTSDIRFSIHNKARLICEILPHVLYQQVFLLLWFCFVFGITISTLGFVHLAVKYIINFTKIKSKRLTGVTLREMEYLKYIKTESKEMYEEVLLRLRGEYEMCEGVGKF